MKKTLILVLVLLLSGCNNSNIIAYIDGEPIIKSEKEKYIDFKTLVLETGIEEGNYLVISNRLEDKKIERDLLVEYYILDNQLEKSDNYLEYNDNQKKEDYFMQFVKKNSVYSIASDADELETTINEYKDYGILVSINSRYDNIRDTIEGQSILHIEKIAKKYDLTYEQCAEEVYGTYIENLMYDNYLVNYYIKSEYEIDIYEIDTLQVEEQIKIAFKEYNDWLNEFYKSSDINEIKR